LIAYSGLLVLAAGCGGINMRQSISPASFLLPGLIQADPQPAPAELPLPDVATVQKIALLR